LTFLTPQEVADILRCSKWFVYANRILLGGIKIGKIVRFEKETFEKKLEEVMKSDSVQAPGQVGLGVLGEQGPTAEKRIRDKARSKDGRGRRPKKSKADEFGLYKLMREQT